MSLRELEAIMTTKAIKGAVLAANINIACVWAMISLLLISVISVSSPASSMEIAQSSSMNEANRTKASKLLNEGDVATALNLLNARTTDPWALVALAHIHSLNFVLEGSDTEQSARFVSDMRDVCSPLKDDLTCIEAEVLAFFLEFKLAFFRRGVGDGPPGVRTMKMKEYYEESPFSLLSMGNARYYDIERVFGEVAPSKVQENVRDISEMLFLIFYMSRSARDEFHIFASELAETDERGKKRFILPFDLLNERYWRSRSNSDLPESSWDKAEELEAVLLRRKGVKEVAAESLKATLNNVIEYYLGYIRGQSQTGSSLQNPDFYETALCWIDLAFVPNMSDTTPLFERCVESYR